MNPNLKHPRAFTVAIALIDYAHRFDNIFLGSWLRSRRHSLTKIRCLKCYRRCAMFKSWIRLTPCWEMLIFRHINRELDNGEFKKVPISGMTIVHTYYIITVYPYVMLLVVVACKHRHIQYTCLYIYTYTYTPVYHPLYYIRSIHISWIPCNFTMAR